MTFSLHDIALLFLVAAPFILVVAAVFWTAHTGFFVTRIKPSLEASNKLYLDRMFGRYTTAGSCLFTVAAFALSAYLLHQGQVLESLAVLTIFTSLLIIRLTHKHFVLLIQRASKDYLFAPHGCPGRPRGARYRFYYPVPEFSDEELQRPASNDDPELLYLYKEIRNRSTWEELRTEIGSNSCHGGRRKLLYRTTGQLEDKDVCEKYTALYGARVTPATIWQSLTEPNLDFSAFAQRWNYYAIMVSRETISRVIHTIFSPISHLVLFLIAGLAFFAVPTEGEPILARSVLFCVSFTSSIVYAAVALMLFIYGKVMALDRLPDPVADLGDPFFKASSRAAVLTAMGTAFAVGLGVPLALSAFPITGTTYYGAVLAGVVTGTVFFIAVWGTHFSMRNTKDKILKELTDEISVSSDSTRMSALLHRYRAVSTLPVWPLKISVVIQMAGATLFPFAVDWLLGIVAG